MWVLISVVVAIWLVSFGWFNRAWKHSYCGSNKLRIFAFSPFMLPLYLFYSLLQVTGSQAFTDVSYKTKRRMVRILRKFESYDWVCFFLPLARKEFFDRCLRQFYFDTDKSWVDSIAYKIDHFITNVLRCNPINWWANLCGQRLILCVYDSKYLFTDWCRLRGDNYNTYFTYSTCFGCLKITKVEYFDKETDDGVNLFLNSLTATASQIKEEKTILFKGFVFTRKQSIKVFKDLIELYPDYWKPSCILKYEYLYNELGYAEDWLEKRPIPPYKSKSFSEGFVFCILVMLATNRLEEEELQTLRTKFAYLLEDNHRHVNKKKLLESIKQFRVELLKYEDKRFEMIWERL